MEQEQLQLDAPRRHRTDRTVGIRPRTWIWTLITLTTVGGAWACSGVGPIGKPVVFGDQTNIVIWDEAHHTEHFIRNARFKAGSADFGFIAPTPSNPELEKASNRAFYTLAALAPALPQGGFGGAAGGARASKSAEVQVIQEADVAGYHATTLKCPDAQAINDWMNEHGYVSTPEVEKWAERYCSKGWYLTAFKVVDKSLLLASTGTVRMSFKTFQPFNPFYVPRTNIPINGGGSLRVYFVSVGNYDAHIGVDEAWQTPRWTAQVPEATGALLAKQVNLPFASVPENCQVEAFVDNNFPRPADDDIYFTKSAEPNPGPTSSTQSPSLGLIFSVMGAFGLVAVVRRRVLG